MAMMREIWLAQKAIQNLEGLRDNMRRNAQGYKDALANSRPAADVLINIQKDVVQYIKRIKWMEDITDDTARQAHLKAGIEALGVTDVAEIATDYQECKAAAQNLNQATELTITQRADQLLSGLDAHDQVW